MDWVNVVGSFVSAGMVGFGIRWIIDVVNKNRRPRCSCGC